MPFALGREFFSRRNHPPASTIIKVTFGYQAGAPYHRCCRPLHRRCGALLRQKVQIHPTILIHEEHILAIIAALRDVVRNIGNDKSCDTNHVRMLSDNRGKCDYNRWLSLSVLDC